MTNKKQVKWIVSLVGVIIALVFGLIAYFAHLQSTAECDEFKNYALNDVPARCVGYYTVTLDLPESLNGI